MHIQVLNQAEFVEAYAQVVLQTYIHVLEMKEEAKAGQKEVEATHMEYKKQHKISKVSLC